MRGGKGFIVNSTIIREIYDMWFVLNMNITSMKYTCTLQQIITLAYWLAYFAHSFTVQLASIANCLRHLQVTCGKCMTTFL